MRTNLDRPRERIMLGHFLNSLDVYIQIPEAFINVTYSRAWFMSQGRSWLSPLGIGNWTLFISNMYFCAMYNAWEFVIRKSYDEIIGN